MTVKIISLLALFWSLHNRRLTPGLTISQARQTRHSANRETSASHDFWSIYSKTLRICFYPGTVVQSAIISMKLTRFIMAVNLVPSLLELLGPEKSKALGTRLNKSLCGITIDLSLGLPWERPSLKMGSVFPSGTIFSACALDCKIDQRIWADAWGERGHCLQCTLVHSVIARINSVISCTRYP